MVKALPPPGVAEPPAAASDALLATSLPSRLQVQDDNSRTATAHSMLAECHVMQGTRVQLCCGCVLSIKLLGSNETQRFLPAVHAMGVM
jgi:hypothetical protein